MAVPKRRTSVSRKGMRRSHHHIDPMQIRYCSHCSQPVLPHRVCSSCGYYKGREIMKVESSEK